MRLSRLSKLNQSLLLLAKIENSQYEISEAISFKTVCEKYISLFDAFIKDKQLTVTTNFLKDFTTSLHPFLADTLISNLLGNAVKYNYPGGKIEITTAADRFSIVNTSMQPPIPAAKLFTRFSGAANSEQPATGLGLAIVKKIADTHNLRIAYEFGNGRHHFMVSKASKNAV